jgi:hypothetical protein
MLDLLRLTEHGAQLFPAAALAMIPDLNVALAGLPPDQAGIGVRGMNGPSSVGATCRLKRWRR